MKESLIKASLDRFKKNMSSYIAVGILCALFLILVSALSIIDELLFFIAIPLVALPILFASHVNCYLLEANQPITTSSFFNAFLGFFRPQFRCSFKGIISFFFSLIIYVGLTVISYVVMYAIFKAHYGDYFLSALDKLATQYLAGDTYEELAVILQENGGVLLTFISFVAALPLPFSIVTFMCLVSYNSISLYFRINMTSGAPSLMRLGISTTYRVNKKEMVKDWFKLNWWLILLPLLGALIAGIICVFGLKEYYLLPTFATIGLFIPLVFFLPFYFPNMEVLYHRYEESFKEGNVKAIEIILQRIQSSIDLSEEEKRKIEESFKNNDDKKKE